MVQVVFENSEAAREKDRVRKLGRRFSIAGALSYKLRFHLDWIPQVFIMDIFGKVGYGYGNITSYQRIMLIAMNFRESTGSLKVEFQTEDSLSQILAIKKFRYILKKFLENVLQHDELDEIIKIGLRKFIEGDLACFSETAILFEEVRQAQARLDLGDPKTAVKLRGILSVLGTVSFCDTHVLHDNTEC